MKRLPTEEESARRYHLFDDQGKLTLVADHGSPWLPADSHRQVRFAHSGGELVATLDLPVREERLVNGFFHTSYALVLDHAVYAIINEYQADNGEDTLPHFIIEAEGMMWLVWGRQQDDALFTLYDQAPANLAIFDAPLESDMLEPIGHIHQTQDDYDFTLTLPTQRLRQPALLSIALVFLIDQLAAV